MPRNRLSAATVSALIDAGPTDLDTPHIQQTRNDTLLQPYLFDGAKLDVRRRAAEKTALENETVVRHRDVASAVMVKRPRIRRFASYRLPSHPGR